MDMGERGMNPVTMTIINPRTEYWPSRGSNRQPPILKPCMLNACGSVAKYSTHDRCVPGSSHTGLVVLGFNLISMTKL